MRILGVVPARMGATRFPGKPLADLAGRPLVQWVYEAAVEGGALDDVVVATPDAEIADVVRSFGGAVEMTSDVHQTGSDRVAEVADRHPEADVVANVQGDQPFVTTEMLEALVSPYRAGEMPPMTTVGAPLDPETGPSDPNVVKVVFDQRGDALYFSRSPIPYRRGACEGSPPVLHHLGLYAFTREFLGAYASMGPTPLEQLEALEQLRVLEHGYRIRVCRVDHPVLEVNTPEDLEHAVELVRSSR